MVGAPITRCAILRKVTFLEKLRMSGEVLAKGHSRMEAVRDARVGAAHEAHQEATDLVCSYLASRRVSIRLKETLSRDDIEWAHLVLSIGGDGTFLRASHSFNDLETTPLLGINSSPESSFGFYCAATARSFPSLFERLERSEVEPRPLWRMRILLNGEKQPILVLNDALFAASSAATTLYYTVRRGGHEQVQKSSGVWISTPAGSTAGILSAGGCIQPWSSRLLQFRVRELFPPSVIGSGLPILGGLFESDFELIPRMTNARLYIDGSNRSISVGYNDRLSFRPSERPINWMASPMCDDNRHNLKKLVHKFKRDCRKAEDAFERQQAEVLVY
ncbi:NAD(+) kinase [Plasmodiophora brassicae]|uniref:NAD(+) kinase n=1 Tax=Plasmodiophora brassicae TaxID=37360 RepID=A0A0G4IZC3_PLABS|nr:hypothetical protein PBRA_001544 [Plasmodiophora brassicae]SPQ94011.1 unnamed protein product [Plasmodiophora brassicae]